MKKYKTSKNASFYTYAVNTINKELIRYLMNNASSFNDVGISFVSLNSLSKEDGLLYEEIYGLEDEKIKNVFINDEVREAITVSEYSNEEFLKQLDDRIYLIMMELKGQNELSKKEIYNLRRRIRYWMKKKEKDNS